MNQNFDFLTLPDELTTGSSIMPHKKNPDVFELIRARCNRLQALPNEISLIMANLPSGYHRDMQLIKENFIPAFQDINDCLRIANFMVQHLKVKDNILQDPKYLYIFSVEVVNNLVLDGMPFRDAYKKVGMDIENKQFKALTEIHHTHEGSIGNLMNEHLRTNMKAVSNDFHFEKIDHAFNSLLSRS
jgi:argininosuccinate lyase